MTRLLAAFFLFLALGAARGQALDKPLVLVAQADLQGVYHRTVVLVVPAAHGRHLGFILNRATEVKLGGLFPEHAPSAKVVDPVYFGGPEMMQSIFAVVKRKKGEETHDGAALHLFGELFVAGDATTVDGIIERTPNDARYFAGFVGWQFGELGKELDAGFWHVTEPDEKLLFRDPSGMWEELRRRFTQLRV